MVLAGIAFGYFRIKRRFGSWYFLIELNLSISVSNVSPANSNVTNILTSLNNLIASNEERDRRANSDIQEVKLISKIKVTIHTNLISSQFQMDDIGASENGTST